MRTKTSKQNASFFSCFLLIILFTTNSYAQIKWFKAGSQRDNYFMSIDSTIKHGENPSRTVKSIESNVKGFGTFMANTSPEKYLGKRIKMTGFVKSNDVENIAALWLRVDQSGSQQFLSFDNMNERPIVGTTDWQKYELVLDVPKNTSNIAFGALVNGAGQIWFDILDFEIVDESVPTTG